MLRPDPLLLVLGLVVLVLGVLLLRRQQLRRPVLELVGWTLSQL
jgi:hypothetical protein